MNTSEHQNKLLEAACKYHTLGYAPIPLIGKNPTTKWGKYKYRQPTIKEIEISFSDPRVTGIGLITGKKWGFFVLDIEKEGLDEFNQSNFPLTVETITGGGGRHLFFKYPKGMTIKNSVKKISNYADIRGDGALVAVPPSKHQSGQFYEWKNSLETCEMADAPASLLEKIMGKQATKSIDSQKSVPKGQRNDSAAKMIGHLLTQHPEEEWDTVVWQNILEWNKTQCDPPLEEKELRSVFHSICSREKEKQSKSDEKLSKKDEKKKKIIDFITHEAILFSDDHGNAYAHYKVKNHWETVSCGSKAFKLWLRKVIYELLKEYVSSEFIKSLIEHLWSIAMFEGDKITLYNRISFNSEENTIIYDMSDAHAHP